MGSGVRGRRCCLGVSKNLKQNFNFCTSDDEDYYYYTTTTMKKKKKMPRDSMLLQQKKRKKSCLLLSYALLHLYNYTQSLSSHFLQMAPTHPSFTPAAKPFRRRFHLLSFHSNLKTSRQKKEKRNQQFRPRHIPPPERTRAPSDGNTFYFQPGSLSSLGTFFLSIFPPFPFCPRTKLILELFPC